MEKSTRIVSNEKTFRTEIPNFIIDLFESGRISKNSFLFYTTCKRIAGDHGGCWVGNVSFSKRLHCSKRDIIKAKEELTRPVPEYGGKPLVIIQKGDEAKNEPDLITIEDIWAENYILFRDKNTRQKLPTQYPLVPPPVPIGTTPLVPIGTQRKNERITKKEPYIKERTSVHNSSAKAKSKKASYERPVSSLSIEKGEGLQATPFPLAAEGLSADKLDELQLQWLLSQKTTKGDPISDKQVMIWIRKFSASLIADAINQAHRSAKKKEIANFYAYIEHTLKALEEKGSESFTRNKKHAENLNRYHNADLKIGNTHCTLMRTGKDFPFALPHETFEQALDQALGYKK